MSATTTTLQRPIVAVPSRSPPGRWPRSVGCGSPPSTPTWRAAALGSVELAGGGSIRRRRRAVGVLAPSGQTAPAQQVGDTLRWAAGRWRSARSLVGGVPRPRIFNAGKRVRRARGWAVSSPPRSRCAASRLARSRVDGWCARRSARLVSSRQPAPVRAVLMTTNPVRCRVRSARSRAGGVPHARTDTTS
jgi:hypothetical protein